LELIKVTVPAVIPPRDYGLRVLMKEYKAYKKALISRVKRAVIDVIKDKSIRVYAQQKYMVERKLTTYLKNLPYHPMPIHNQSYWIEKENGSYRVHIKTKHGEASCLLIVPKKYRFLIERAIGKSCPYKANNNMCVFKECPFNTPKMCDSINPHLGQMELIEDTKYGWVNCHIVLRLPKPKSYEPKGWVGVDVGWNKLATSILATANPHLRFSNPSIHGKALKTRIIQLKYLMKQYARKGKSWKKWNFRLKHTIKYTVGVVAKEIVSKAKKYKAGVVMEDLTFKSHTKKWLIPRYKLMVAIKTLCEREGVPFKLVPSKYTSIRCPKCGHIDKRNRRDKRFRCVRCDYKADADIAAAMNIAAIGMGLAPIPKSS